MTNGTHNSQIIARLMEYYLVPGIFVLKSAKLLCIVMVYVLLFM